MSADTDISQNPPVREQPLGNEPVEDETKTSTEVDKETKPDNKESIAESSNFSSNQNEKTKPKNENAESSEDSNKALPSTTEKEIGGEIEPKDGKTKVNMERQKQLSKDPLNTVDPNTAGNKEEDANKVDEEDELADLSNPDELDGNARNKVYQRGLDYFNKGKKTTALKCFMACLTGLADKEGFSFLPQCLKYMADIYYSREEYEKAIQFIQAEKMYYETALINTTGLQKKLEENMKENKDPKAGEGTESTESKDPEALRAEEYENLARMCLQKKQPELALEYQGKATKLRQQVYGISHPETKKSLDFFTVVYAEVGKQQYTESLQKFSESPAEVSSQSPSGGSTEPGVRRRPSGILRTPSEESRNKDRHVRFEEPEPRIERSEVQQQEESISQSILWVLFVICIVILAVLVSYLYCRLDPGSYACTTWRRQSNYYYMRFKYLYYTWNSNSNSGNKFG